MCFRQLCLEIPMKKKPVEKATVKYIPNRKYPKWGGGCLKILKPLKLGLSWNTVTPVTNFEFHVTLLLLCYLVMWYTVLWDVYKLYMYFDLMN